MTDRLQPPAPPATTASPSERAYLLERIGEAAVVQLYADGFKDLGLDEKTVVWHLYQAAIAGRDIFYDQKYAHSLLMRDVLETLLERPAPIAPDSLEAIRQYTKLFWINSGPHNNLTARKFVPECTALEFDTAVRAAAAAGAPFPLAAGETLDGFLARIRPLFFDLAVDPIVTSKTPPAGRDILKASANNLYVGVSMADIESFDEKHPINSRIVKHDGRVVEEVYRIGGRYSRQIAAIVEHLNAAIPFAARATADALRALIKLYTTGEETDREAYDIAWVQDAASPVDTINGFVEVYLDARGIKGAWEGLVYFENREKTTGIRTLAEHAQWFEDRMPWAARYRKEGVRGISARAIDVVVETGDSGPITPVGINLPNDQVIRERYGSKSVLLANVNEAYERSTLPEFRSEFSWTPDEVARANAWSADASELTTTMHEVIGHGSGKVAERLNGNPQAVLREQYSCIEESRADLVALYFLPDPKLVELGLVSKEHHQDIVRAEYEGYARNALVQLRRVREGTQLEEDHMRSRQLIVGWLMANSSAIETRTRDGKTYYVMTDVVSFREGVGRLLAEVQRIKSEGDYAAAKALVEAYGVHFDGDLRDEIVRRVETLRLPSYTGFVMPKLQAVRDASGRIIDVVMSYPQDLASQMLEYSAATRELRG